MKKNLNLGAIIPRFHHWLPGIKDESTTVFANSFKFLSVLKTGQKLGNYSIPEKFRDNLILG